MTLATRARAAAGLVVAAALAGCASGPYLDRDLVDHKGETTRYKFAYGKFCGPNYPKLGSGQSLRDFWPPADDIDALCYAHDYCYVLVGPDSYDCDTAMRRAALDIQPSLRGSGCWDVITEMFLGFHAKPYSQGKDAAENVAVRLVGGSFGVVTAVLMQILKAPLSVFLKPAEEGTCNVAQTKNPKAMVGSFEQAFLDAHMNTERRRIRIPVAD